MNRQADAARKFVVAFNRDRDCYQVPLALHAAGMLEALVTDFYRSDNALVQRLTPKRLRRRHTAGLPGNMVHSSLKALLLQVYHEARDAGGDGWYLQVDEQLSRNAADIAAAGSADLLLYSQYALEAFTDARLARRQKGLFFYHPHPTLGHEILTADFARFPECAWSVNNATELVNEVLKARIDSEIALADFIICASSFTRHSLIHHGVPAERIRVVPYGAEPIRRAAPAPKTSARTQFLFVGQGMQRKGLHHLLHAWKQARLENSTLRVICSKLDPGFEPLLDQPGIEYSGAVSRAEVLEAFAAAHIFVMPSLYEGFGLVYLEALASGCFLIGTPNTGVPDLGLPGDMARLVEPGNVEQICSVLRETERLRAAGAMDHGAIVRFADSLSWSAFRRRIVETLNQPELQARRHG
ncbi:MAG: glycosyltransferase [Steroidobacteraceae bacterium]